MVTFKRHEGLGIKFRFGSRLLIEHVKVAGIWLLCAQFDSLEIWRSLVIRRSFTDIVHSIGIKRRG